MPHHVLLVDDDTLVLKVLRTVLDHDEFRVTTATDGPAALEIMAADPADAFVTKPFRPLELLGVVRDLGKPSVDGPGR